MSNQEEQGGYLGMSGEEASEYINGLVSGTVAIPMDLANQQAVVTLKEFFAEQNVVQRTVVALRQKLAHNENELKRLEGGIGAISTVLYRAEATRRQTEALKREEYTAGNADSGAPNGAAGEQTPAEVSPAA